MSVWSLCAVSLGAAVLLAGGSGVLLSGEAVAWQLENQSAEGPIVVAQTPPQTTTPPAAAPATTQPSERGPGWAVNCASDPKAKSLDCRLSQTVVTQNRQFLASVTFHFPPAPQKPETIVRVPLGVLLPANAALQVDDNTAQQLNFRACDRNGCYAQAPLSPEVLAQLRKGKQITVAFKNLSEKDIKIPLSLDGFGEAYGKVPSS